MLSCLFNMIVAGRPGRGRVSRKHTTYTNIQVYRVLSPAIDRDIYLQSTAPRLAAFRFCSLLSFFIVIPLAFHSGESEGGRTKKK
jgi:hypothetical protein